MQCRCDLYTITPEMVTQEKYDELLRTYEALESKYRVLFEFTSYLKRMLFGRKSEKRIGADNSLQGTLFDMAPEAELVETPREVVTYERKKPSSKSGHAGRNPFTEDMPAEERVILHEAADPDTMERIGESVTEQLSMKPARLFVKRFIYPKYKDPLTGLILQAPAVESAFSRFKVDETVAAHVVVQKIVDHLPLYRQARIFERQKVTLAESTLGDIYSHVARQLLPLYEAHRKDVLSAGYINVDETPIKVLESEKKGAIHRGYYWVFHDPVARSTLFQYHPGRSQEAPQHMLRGFEGYLQSDAYVSYEPMGKVPGITLVGCLVHARRYFYEAKESDRALAEEALALFGAVYAVEERIRSQGLTGEEKLAYRQEHAVPALEELRRWMREKYEQVQRPTSPIRKAIDYSLKRWDRLTLYAGTHLLDPDNNRVENAIRPVAVGRKNYLFAGSHEAAQRSAMLYSLLGTCKNNGMNPYEWLTDVLVRLPSHPINRIRELLPQYNRG